MRLPFGKPFIAGQEMDYILQAVASGHLSGNGDFTQRCHAWFERNLGAPKALLTHSCTAALEMAALLCDLQPGDEVIMPAYTFVSTANAFVLRGAVPVFVDIRPDTLNLDERLVESAITHRTRALVAVHYAGVACEMDALLDITRRHGLWLIEDAAQALLSRYKGRFLGTLGHAGCLSFHETKNIISGEGGALLVQHEPWRQRAEIIWEKGTDRSRFFRGEVDKYTWQEAGSSFLPGELTAAFLWGQLEHATDITTHRRNLCLHYWQELSGLAASGCLTLPERTQVESGNGHLFHLLAANLEERSRLIAHLRGDGIHAVFHYVPLHLAPAGQRLARSAGSLPVTCDIADRLIRLPLFHTMTTSDVTTISASIHRFYGVTA
jgi:dTDP-4-amino-4,6-dideoxygalactose transaminase